MKHVTDNHLIKGITTIDKLQDQCNLYDYEVYIYLFLSNDLHWEP